MTILDEIFQRSDGFESPVCISGYRPPYTLEMVRESLVGVAATTGPAALHDVRLYSNRRGVTAHTRYRVLQAIQQYPSLEDVDWDAVFGGEDFFIIINNAARYSAVLNRASHALIAGFGDRFEPDGVSIDHAIIIGRYSETPFEVHVDHATDRVIHFNLGPAEREMILWPRDEYVAAYGDRTLPLASVGLSGATRYTIPPDSCFVLPADYFHVGCSSGLSIVVSLEFSRLTFAAQFQLAMKDFLDTLPGDESDVKYWKAFLTHSPDWLRHAARDSLASRGLDDLLFHLQARRSSNNSIRERLPLTQPSVPDYPTQYVIEQPSRLQVIETISELHLYSRGHHSLLSNAREITDFRDALATNEFVFDQRILHDAVVNRNRVLLTLAWLIATGDAQPVRNTEVSR